MQMRPEVVLNYITPAGRDPYRRWYTRIKDEKTRAIITSRVERLQLGNPGDSRRLNKDLYEIYFGFLRNRIVILLGGGTKRTQQRDIARAQDYWNEFLERIKESQQ